MADIFSQFKILTAFGVYNFRMYIEYPTLSRAINNRNLFCLAKTDVFLETVGYKIP